MAGRESAALRTAAVQPRWRIGGLLVGSGKALRKNPNMAYGLIIVVVMASAAIFAPWVATTPPKKLDTSSKFQSPSSSDWFGSDHLGRDVFSRTIYGSRVSLFVGTVVAVSAMIIGGTLGLLSGYSRRLDAVLMRIVDGLMAIPTILLGMALMAMMGGSVQNIIIALTITQSPLTARVMRSSVLELKEEMYVESARAIGASPARVIRAHILPNALAPLIVQATFIAASAVLIEAALSFLGAGVPPATASWGGMMAEAQNYLSIAMWIIIFPGVFLTLTVLGISLAGDGLRDSLDPKLRRAM